VWIIVAYSLSRNYFKCAFMCHARWWNY
jgi:hypothetical protein